MSVSLAGGQASFRGGRGESRPAARQLLAAPWLAVAVCVSALTGTGVAQSYTTILDASEDQTPQGVRGADGSDVVLACSYTLSGSLPQGMWWKGSLATGSGTAFKPTISIGGQAVTSSIFYGPNTPEFDPSLGAGNLRIVGSYQYTGSTQFNNGLLYTGPLTGVGGSWSQINVPDSSVSATVANTIPHSVMGSIVVGNYNLVIGGTAAGLGNAFLYDITSGSFTIFDTPFGGTNKLTSAYGVWQNGIGSSSYTIAGGSEDAGFNKAFLVDYDSTTRAFSNLTYFADGTLPALTHFEGITGTPYGYNVIGIAGTGYGFASIPRKLDGTFGPATWAGPLSYPGSTFTTGNTVIGDQAIGIYSTSTSSLIYAYVATVTLPVPEIDPAGLGTVTALLAGLAGLAERRLRRPVRTRR